jgi:hypothetical protein
MVTTTTTNMTDQISGEASGEYVATQCTVTKIKMFKFMFNVTLYCMTEFDLQ